MTADFDYRLEGDDILLIIDRNQGGRSVTNDAENVIATLADRGVPVDRHIIYRDSIGRWDEMIVARGRFEGFAPIGVKDEIEAIRLVRQHG